MKNLFLFFLVLPTVINFILLIVWLYKCRGYLKNFFYKQGWGMLIFLCIIFVVSFILRVTIVSPKHLMYTDEFLYMKAAKNLLMFGNFGDYRKSLGWPFINAIMFGIFGVSNWVSIYTSIFFGSLTTINIFLMVYFLFRDKYIAMLSSLIFAMMPAHILWSATAETNVVSIFFVTSCILVLFLYFKVQNEELSWLSLLLISFTAQIRGENYILFGLFIVGAFIFIKRMPKVKSDIWFISICLSLPNLIQLVLFQFSTNWLEKESAGAMQGQNFSFHNLYSNSAALAPRLFDGSLYPELFVVLFLIGFIYLWYFSYKHNLFLFTWFIVIYLIYFAGWFQVCNTFSAKARYFIAFYPIFTLWFASGLFFCLEKIKYLRLQRFFLIVIASIILIYFLPYANIEGARHPQNRLETEVIEKAEAQLPTDCIIVANFPEVLTSTTSLKVIRIEDFLRDSKYQDTVFRQYKCVLFFEDYFCFAFPDPVIRNNCSQIKDTFYLEPFKSYSINYDKYDLKQISYTFYRIQHKK